MDLMRSIDMSRLELVKQLEFEQLRMRLYKLYGIEIETMEPAENGAGGLTYFVTEADKKYVVKYPSDNEMNHPDVEIKVCEMLLEHNIPACRFIHNKQGNILSSDETGRRFTVQVFYKGTTYAYNEASLAMQKESAVCNFYGQYYDSLSKNRTVYLEQANMSSRLLLWFEKHLDELNERLCELSMLVAC